MSNSKYPEWAGFGVIENEVVVNPPPAYRRAGQLPPQESNPRRLRQLAEGFEEIVLHSFNNGETATLFGDIVEKRIKVLESQG